MLIACWVRTAHADIVNVLLADRDVTALASISGGTTTGMDQKSSFDETPFNQSATSTSSGPPLSFASATITATQDSSFTNTSSLFDFTFAGSVSVNSTGTPMTTSQQISGDSDAKFEFTASSNHPFTLTLTTTGVPPLGFTLTVTLTDETNPMTILFGSGATSGALNAGDNYKLSIVGQEGWDVAAANNGTFIYHIDFAVVPEPDTLALLTLGGALGAFICCRKSSHL